MVKRHKTSSPGRPPKLSEEERRRAREWAAIGTRMGEAAATFGVSVQTLRRAIREQLQQGEQQ